MSRINTPNNNFWISATEEQKQKVYAKRSMTMKQLWKGREGRILYRLQTRKPLLDDDWLYLDGIAREYVTISDEDQIYQHGTIVNISSPPKRTRINALYRLQKISKGDKTRMRLIKHLIEKEKERKKQLNIHFDEFRKDRKKRKQEIYRQHSNGSKGIPNIDVDSH